MSLCVWTWVCDVVKGCSGPLPPAANHSTALRSASHTETVIDRAESLSPKVPESH